MTTADQIRDHQARCLPFLLQLEMLTRDETESDQQPEYCLQVVIQATGAVLAEAASACLGASVFMQARLDRLATAADDAAAAARDGNAADLRRRLYRFDTLTTAIWTVQHALCRPDSQATRGAPTG